MTSTGLGRNWDENSWEENEESQRGASLKSVKKFKKAESCNVAHQKIEKKGSEAKLVGSLTGHRVQRKNIKTPGARKRDQPTETK